MKTIKAVIAKIAPLLGTVYTIPVTRNKGTVGNFLEDLAGIPHTPNCLDCLDGEIKTVPLKPRHGKYVLKETIAITMLCKKDLYDHDFQSSKCFTPFNISRAFYLRPCIIKEIQYIRTSLALASGSLE